MRKVTLLLSVLLFFVSGCADEPEQTVKAREDDDMENEIQEDEIETLFEQNTDLILFDTEELKANLLKVRHGRTDVTDYVALKVEIENKQNRTFEFYVKDLKVDGKEIDQTRSWIDEDEIEPSETKTVFINGYELEELSIQEHVSGRIIYRDYDNNRYDIKFSEYINE